RAVLEGLDSASLVMLLSAFRWRGKPLADQVEPTPLAVAGNFLVLRAPVDEGEPSGLGTGGATWGDLLEERGLTSEQRDVRLVPIPTGGVFAEAVLGRSNSAEKLDITRFWNWQDSPIPLQPPEIAPVAVGTRATAEDLRPGQLGAPVLNILNPTALPDPAGLSAVLGTLASANLFRDMSGLAGTQQLAQAAAAGTSEAATEAGKLAGANLKTVTDQAVAMGQTAADMWKASLASKEKGDKTKGISADGARINHGRDMDERGVTGQDEAGGGMESGPRMEAPASGGGSGADGGGVGRSTGGASREAAFADSAATGVSPGLLGESLGALGADVIPAALTIPTMPIQPVIARHVQEKAALDTIRQDVIASGASMRGVELHPMRKHDHGDRFKPLFFAWTNDASTVYVNLDNYFQVIDSHGPLVARGDAAMSIRHELVHVGQFKKAGRHPKSFKEMVRHELEAYGCKKAAPGAPTDWLDKKKGGAEDFLTKTMGLDPDDVEMLLAAHRNARDENCPKLRDADALTHRDPKKRERLILDALIDKLKGLPEELVKGQGRAYQVGDLYKTKAPGSIL
ncbi:MAG: hypothetical protein R3190_16460, partial [Thermoanaerobaculia bacterium]|nr:hypothetical protein [Thermoanaerobaculia bacterium]